MKPNSTNIDVIDVKDIVRENEQLRSSISGLEAEIERLNERIDSFGRIILDTLLDNKKGKG